MNRPQLPNPCPNSWNQMTPVEGGRHCKGCDHLVMDFRGKSNDEIRQVLEANTKVCGVFEEHQLHEAPLAKKSNWYRFKFAAAALLAIIGFQMKPLAQTTPTPKPPKGPKHAQVCPVDAKPSKKARKHKRRYRLGLFRRKHVRGRVKMGSIGCPSF